MGVTTHAHRDDLDQRRTQAGARPFDRPGERGGNSIRIGPIDGDAGNAIAGGFVSENPSRRLLVHWRGQRRLVVFDAEHGWQATGSADVDRFVPFSE